MKSHSKASPQRSCLAARSCWRFSPTRRDAGLGQRAHLLQRHVLGRRRGSRPRRRRPARASLEVGRDLGRRRCRGSAPATSASPARSRRCPPGGRCGRASRRWEKKSSGSQLVQRPADSTRSTPAARQQPPRDLGQVEHAARRRSRRRGRRRRRAPRRRPRSSRARSRGRSRRRSRRPPRRPRRRCRPASPRQPQCSIATPAGPGERDRQAVGGEDERRQARARVTTWPSASGISLPGSRERARAAAARVEGQLGAVDLAADRRSARARSPSAAASRRRFSITASVASSVRTPRLRRSKGGSLTPPRRVEKAARAPPQVGLEPAHAVALAPLHRP